MPRQERIRFRTATSALILGFAFLLISTPTVAAEADPSEPRRTSNGRPDLEGVWDFRTLTPLVRPEDKADQAVLSEEEAAEIESNAAARTAQRDQPSDPDREAPPQGGDLGAYNSFWLDSGARVSSDRRTSLIIDPPNGRLPPTQPGVQKHDVHSRGVGGQSTGDDLPTDLPVRLRVGGIGNDGPESRGLAERCLLGFNSGPPIIPAGYNQNIRIVQTEDHVVILSEMVHDARIVPIDGRGRLPMHIRPWMGSSLGRWDGDTLVVETTNFSSKVTGFSADVVASVGNAEHMRVTERFQRIDEGTLRYEFTVDDPATYTRPFTGVMPMKSGDRLYEFACHEGNYAMGNILRGSRLLEREAGEPSGR